MIEYKTIKCEFKEVPKKGNYHVINSKGDQFWFVNGKLHRDNDLPACVYCKGNQFWYQKGLKHRDNDQPAIIMYDGNKYWYHKGKQYTPNSINLDKKEELKKSLNKILEEFKNIIDNL